MDGPPGEHAEIVADAGFRFAAAVSAEYPAELG